MDFLTFLIFTLDPVYNLSDIAQNTTFIFCKFHYFALKVFSALGLEDIRWLTLYNALKVLSVSFLPDIKLFHYNEQFLYVIVYKKQSISNYSTLHLAILLKCLSCTRALYQTAYTQVLWIAKCYAWVNCLTCLCFHILIYIIVMIILVSTGGTIAMIK